MGHGGGRKQVGGVADLGAEAEGGEGIEGAVASAAVGGEVGVVVAVGLEADVDGVDHTKVVGVGLDGRVGDVASGGGGGDAVSVGSALGVGNGLLGDGRGDDADDGNGGAYGGNVAPSGLAEEGDCTPEAAAGEVKGLEVGEAAVVAEPVPLPLTDGLGDGDHQGGLGESGEEGDECVERDVQGQVGQGVVVVGAEDGDNGWGEISEALYSADIEQYARTDKRGHADDAEQDLPDPHAQDLQHDRARPARDYGHGLGVRDLGGCGVDSHFDA